MLGEKERTYSYLIKLDLLYTLLLSIVLCLTLSICARPICIHVWLLYNLWLTLNQTSQVGCILLCLLNTSSSLSGGFSKRCAKNTTGDAV
jgi:hypothetical protein